MTVNTAVSPVPTLKAAPGFLVSQNSRMLPIRCTGWSGRRCATTTALVVMSAASTQTATQASTAPGRLRGGSPSLAPAPTSAPSGLSGVPGAACTPRTMSPAGMPAAVPSLSACRTIRTLHMFRPRSALARVVAQRELMLPLEQLRASVGLVVAGLGRRVAQAGGDLRLRLAELGAQRDRFFLQFKAKLGELGVGPRILARPHRQIGGAVRRSGHVRFLGSFVWTDNGGYGPLPSVANPFGHSRIPRSFPPCASPSAPVLG